MGSLKCQHCGSVVSRTDDRERDDAGARDVSDIVASLIVLVLAGGATCGVIYGYSQWKTEDFKEELREEVSVECRVAELEKDMKLPPATDEELWCEAHGFCGEPRRLIADRLSRVQKKLKDLSKGHEESLKKLRRCRQEEESLESELDECYDDIDAYVTHSKQSVCDEIMLDLEDELMVMGDILSGCRRQDNEKYVKLEYMSYLHGVPIPTYETAYVWWSAED